MATDKTFSVVGVSSLNGEYKVRFANDIMRIKVLAKHGHEDIRLADLGMEVSKYEGIKQLQALDEFQDAAAQSAISEYLDEKAPKVAKAPKVPVAKAAKVVKAKVVKPHSKESRELEALAQAKAVAIADAEDAPF